MIKLTIDNSICQIEGLTTEEMKIFRSAMSYKIDTKSNYFIRHRSNVKYLIDKKGYFPTGLLYIALTLNKKHLTQGCEVKDLRIKPLVKQKLFTLKLQNTPYLEQREAAETVLTKSRGIIVAPTGVGKSMILALMINNLQVRTLVVVPSLELKRQLTSSLRHSYGDVVGPLGNDIAVENVDALNPKLTQNYNCVIIDEFHHSGAKTYRELNKISWKNVYYKYGLTATPFRSQENERLLLESVLSKVIYRIEYKTAVEKGYIVPMEAYYVDIPKTAIEGNPTKWTSMYSELVVSNLIRNKTISYLIDIFNKNDVSTLILVKEIVHGNSLKGIYEDYYSKEIQFANGQEGNNRQLILEFILGHRKQLIGTTGVLGEGVDTKPAEVIIIGGLGKSKNAFMQQVGRGFRKNPDKVSCKIIIFKDKSHKWTLTHYKEQCKILKEEYEVTPVRLDIDFSKLP